MININEYCDNLISNRRSEIINEGLLANIGKGLVKGIANLIIKPLLALLAISCLLAFIIHSSTKVNKNEIAKILEKNPDLLNRLEIFGKSVYESLCKINPSLKKYLEFKFNKNIKLVYNTNSYKYEIRTNIIFFNANKVFKEITGYDNAYDWENDIGWKDPDSEPDCKEFNEFIKSLENSIDSVNRIIHDTIKSNMISLSFEYDKEYILNDLGCYNDEDIYKSDSSNWLILTVYVYKLENIKLPEPLKNIIKKDIEILKTKIKC